MSVPAAVEVTPATLRVSADRMVEFYLRDQLPSGQIKGPCHYCKLPKCAGVGRLHRRGGQDARFHRGALSSAPTATSPWRRTTGSWPRRRRRRRALRHAPSPSITTAHNGIAPTTILRLCWMCHPELMFTTASIQQRSVAYAGYALQN